MTNPLLTLYLALDHAVEKICDAAFRVAATPREPREEFELIPREQVLIDLNEGRDVSSAEGLAAALHASLVRKEGDEYVMTALGRYAFPRGYELRPREPKKATSGTAAARP